MTDNATKENFIESEQAKPSPEIENYYGFHQNNYGDIPEFQGNYINFGYWKEISLEQPISVEDRIKSPEDLYLHIIEQLNLHENDNVLEVGCGRGNGIINIINRYKVKKLFAVDESPSQIARSKNNIKAKTQTELAIDFILGSAGSIKVEDASIDKIYSVEVIQHFKTFTPFVKEINRLLRPNGKIVLTAHLSTNEENYELLRKEDLLVEGDVLLPIQKIIEDLKSCNFNVSYYSIGNNVFEGFEKWINQLDACNPCSYDIYKAYQKQYIDYFVITATK